ncbi:MAG: alanine/ornithine racemase family PLP-dependent enzyme [Clostridia bacterium]|nr:alanine/ornithine racemase family PLP-dependent enzyme [Clostridia bacterium]
MYPNLEINLSKITHNLNVMKNLCKDIKIAGVIKVFCGNPIIAQTLVDGGIDYLADSRIQNLIKVQSIDAEKILLRLPSHSETDLVVQYADISLNSELSTIKKLNESAKQYNKHHKIILMVDLGDLREGIFNEPEIFNVVSEVIQCQNIILEGLGTNLTCFGGVIPSHDNLNQLVQLQSQLEHRFNIKLNVISGGNSSSIHLVQRNEMPNGINHLRLGEAIYFGREAAYLKNIPETFDDAAILKAEIIEVRNKPSVPIGTITFNAFGHIPTFEDKGVIKRAICAVGRQDIYCESLTPLDENIQILGDSSDHLLLHLPLDSTYQVGDILSFKVKYQGVLRAMTSEYIDKRYIKG